MVKGGPKMLTLGPSLFHKYLNLSKKFQTLSLFAEVLPLVRISAVLDHIGGVRAQKPPKKDYFKDAESVPKTYKIFNLTTQNAIPMKLTTIMYLHESVHLFFFIKNSFLTLAPKIVLAFLKNRPKKLFSNCLVDGLLAFIV